MATSTGFKISMSPITRSESEICTTQHSSPIYIWRTLAIRSLHQTGHYNGIKNGNPCPLLLVEMILNTNNSEILNLTSAFFAHFNQRRNTPYTGPRVVHLSVVTARATATPQTIATILHVVLNVGLITSQAFAI